MKKIVIKLIGFSVNKPGLTTFLTIVLALLFAFQVPKIKIDTDPENMLKENEPVRITHKKVKESLALYDMLVAGIVEEDEEGSSTLTH